MATKEELKLLFATGEIPTGEDFSALIDGVEGPKGAKGDTGSPGKDGTDGSQGPKGEDGAKGATGTAGKDGFGTEVQYDDIIARLEALETPEV